MSLVSNSINNLEKIFTELRFSPIPKTITVKKSFLKEFPNFNENVKEYMGIYSEIPIIFDNNIKNEFQIEVEYHSPSDIE